MWVYRFCHIYNILVIISSSTFSITSLFWVSNYTMLDCLIVLHRLWMHCSFFFKSFSLYLILSIFYHFKFTSTSLNSLIFFEEGSNLWIILSVFFISDIIALHIKSNTFVSFTSSLIMLFVLYSISLSIWSINIIVFKFHCLQISPFL